MCTDGDNRDTTRGNEGRVNVNGAEKSPSNDDCRRKAVEDARVVVSTPRNANYCRC